MFIYFWLHWVFIALLLLCMHGLSLVAVSRDDSLTALHGLLTVVVPLVAERGSRAHRLQLWCMGLVAPRDVGS